MVKAIILHGQGLVDKMNGLSAWCKVTVLRLEYCHLGRTGAVRLAEAIASFLSASLTELVLEENTEGRDTAPQHHPDVTQPRM
jgi:hypothetical protein